MLAQDLTLIVKVTNACDFRCAYCFIEPAIFHKSMSVETGRLLVRSFLDSPELRRVLFVWHGGEPLLRGKNFLQAMLAEQRARPTTVRVMNAIQTNATRLDPAMLAFLLENAVEIGLSLDGPQGINDAVRRPRSACRSAYETTLKAANSLAERGRRPGAIVVVSRANVDVPAEVYATFRTANIDIKLNPITRAGLAAVDSSLGIRAAEYGDFLIALFDAWWTDTEAPISIDPFRQHLHRLIDEPVSHNCVFALHCHRHFLGISPDGDIFPCGMFQGEPAFRYGNLRSLAPRDISATPLFADIETREQRVLKDCEPCAFHDLCYGGCMFHALKDGRVLNERDWYCEGYRRYFVHLAEKVRDDLRSGGACTQAHLS
jgi:uncharacterized protein